MTEGIQHVRTCRVGCSVGCVDGFDGLELGCLEGCRVGCLISRNVLSDAIMRGWTQNKMLKNIHN